MILEFYFVVVNGAFPNTTCSVHIWGLNGSEILCSSLPYPPRIGQAAQLESDSDSSDDDQDQEKASVEARVPVWQDEDDKADEQ